jgi:maleylacetate reductase
MRKIVYRYSAMERVIFGEAAPLAVAAEVDLLARRRVFVVTSRSVAAGAPFAAIIAALGDRCAGQYADVTAHVPRDCVVAGAAAARAANADLLLAVGGGSAIDATKMMLLCLRYEITKTAALDAHRGLAAVEPSFRSADEASWLRMIAVPTTLSAAEFTWWGGALDTVRQVKEPFGYPLMMPKSVVLDPKITLATPLALFLSSGMKAVDHAAERLASLNSEPFKDAAVMQSLRLLSRGLPRTREQSDDLQARLDCQMGMAIGMMGPATGAGVGASHAIGHALGANNGVAHGITSCVLLPAVMRWNRPANAEKQKLISEAMGRPQDDATTVLEELVERLGLPRRLRDLAIRRDDFPAIADRVLHDRSIRSNPREVTSAEQVMEILELAW